MLRIAIGSDHRGYEHKSVIQKAVSLETATIQWLDVGTSTKDRTDYPPIAYNAVQLLLEGKADCGILLCGTGVGMAIVANRYNGIFAAIAWDEITAARCKEEDNANVLSLPADYLTPQQAVALTIIWLNAQFLGERYQKRIDMINALKK